MAQDLVIGGEIYEKVERIAAANTSGEIVLYSAGEGTSGVGIKSIVQTVVSDADSGYNILTITMTDCTETFFRVRNGSGGSAGNTPELTAGTVEMLDVESDPYMEIGGTKEKPVLNLGIPHGEQQGIKKQASGEAIMLRDISPVAHKMKVTADSDATVYATAANIIPFPYPGFATGSPYTQNGVTATVQDDGGILLNGTATATSYFVLCQIRWHDVSFNSNPNVVSNPNFKTSYVKNRWEAAYDAGNGRTFVTIQKGAAFNNEVIYPMITSADYPDDMPFVTGATPNSVNVIAGYDESLYSFPSECFVFANKSGVSVNVEYNAAYTDIIEAVNKQINLIVNQPSETQTPDKDGFYTLEGILRTDLAGAYHTDLIPVSNYNHIESVSRLYNQGYILAFFDKRKQIMHDVSVVGADPAMDYEIDMDIPEGVAYCALSHYASAGAAQPYIKLSFKVGEETVLSSLKGKVINVLGDSITSVDYTLPNWWQKIAERTGARFNNYGVSSTSIAVRSGRTDSFLERADQLDVNADAVFIMGGTNDGNALIGEWNSTDTTTFFGALNALFPKICEKFPGKPIIVATPIQSTATYPSIQLDAVALVKKVLDAYNADPSKQSDWWILQTRAECIKLKAAQYGLPCLDLFYTSGINGADSEKIYFRPNDTLHPSAYGQERLAVLIQAELEKHFH